MGSEVKFSQLSAQACRCSINATNSQHVKCHKFRFKLKLIAVELMTVVNGKLMKCTLQQ